MVRKKSTPHLTTRDHDPRRADQCNLHTHVIANNNKSPIEKTKASNIDFVVPGAESADQLRPRPMLAQRPRAAQRPMVVDGSTRDDCEGGREKAARRACPRVVGTLITEQSQRQRKTYNISTDPCAGPGDTDFDGRLRPIRVRKQESRARCACAAGGGGARPGCDRPLSC